ncbi:MAG: hypothetical protein L0Z55_05195 [Planctomycetes bacterium]|nr:hypothetical protein [Planctomycetota bacterium]
MKQMQSAIGFLRAMFVNDLKNKGMAFLLALLVWWFAFNHTIDTAMTDVEVRIMADREDRAVVERRIVSALDPRALETPFGGKVKLSIRGQVRLVNKIRDNPTACAGEIRVAETREVALGDTAFYNLPPGVEVTAADPAVLLVTVEDLVVAEKRIELAYGGKPPSPYRFLPNKVVYEFETIPVRGPRSQVERIESVPTEVFDLQKLREPSSKHKLRFPAQLSADAPLVVLAPGAATEVGVTIELQDLRKRDTFVVPVHFVIPPEHKVVVAALDKVGLVCVGTEEQFAELRSRIHDGKMYAMYRVPTDRPPGVPHLVAPKLDDLIIPREVMPAGIEIIGTDPSNPAYNFKREEE